MICLFSLFFLDYERESFGTFLCVIGDFVINRDELQDTFNAFFKEPLFHILDTTAEE